ncbi:glycosyltransferase [Coralliovum pocilloporae]|uniref:glycosyltransferase n=1 Tax=Coralliovum pocilloporae TaxID=3066369 RepID=UPI003306F123
MKMLRKLAYYALIKPVAAVITPHETRHLKEKNALLRKQRDKARNQRMDAANAAKRALLIADSQGGKKANYFSDVETARQQYEDLEGDREKLEIASISVREMEHGVKSPVYTKVFPQRRTPPRSVAFVTIANDLFLPGLEVLLASFLDVYPDFESDVIVFHDGSISNFSMRRARHIYPNVHFREPDMSWLGSIARDSQNRKRIGIFGYMSVMALGLTDYERVVVLDSDTAIIDDISHFWTGEDLPLGAEEKPATVEDDTIFACQDYGARPWAAVSPGTGQPIINSGILSIPRRYMDKTDFDELKDLVRTNHKPFCPLLDRFADQKAWNRFIYARQAEFLPINFNCNIKFLDQNRAGDTSFIRMIHFAGYKPWFHEDFMDESQIPQGGDGAVRPSIWRMLNLQKLGRLRQQHYQTEISRPGYFDRRVEKPGTIDGKPACLFIGNGPSINETDLCRLKEFETFTFDWFIHHPDFDAIKPDHLVLGSHAFFGGWHTRQPTMPKKYISTLRKRAWRPQIWTSFYFREYFEISGLADEFDIRYVLFEKPQKELIDVMGTSNLDIDGFTHDGRTSLLSVALPIALRLGYRQIGLVGCDNGSDGKDSSFNGAGQDTSTGLQAEDEPGRFALARVQESLQQLGGSFVDFTPNSSLPLPKGDLSEL